MGKKVVFVCTSADQMRFKDGSGSMPTGLWLEELAAPYYICKEAGYEVTVASVQGGPVPIDISSMQPNFFTDHSKKFMHDAEAVGSLCHTISCTDLEKNISDYDAIFCCGGHGTVVDFVESQSLHSAIEKMVAMGKVVGAVCHGPVALVGCKKPNGEPLMKDLLVTSFSNEEEGPNGVGLHEKVAFLPEDRLREQGASYSCGGPWSSTVQVADIQGGAKIVTGQNPQSSEACARKMLEVMAV